MAALYAIQSHTLRMGAFLVGWWILAGVAVAFAIADPEQALRHPAVTITARAFVGLWFGAVAVTLCIPPEGWRTFSPRVWFARWLWTLGLGMHIVHVIFAFWLAHGWSYAAAVRHVEAVGGFGEGIVANELFLAVWTADVIWWWAKPASYARRSRWTRYPIHAFLVFIVFNATVVFGTSEVRVMSAILFGILVVLWWRRERVA